VKRGVEDSHVRNRGESLLRGAQYGQSRRIVQRCELARLLDRGHDLGVDDDGSRQRAAMNDAMRRGIDGRRDAGSQLAEHDVGRLPIAQVPQRPALAADDQRRGAPDSFDSHIEPPRRRFEVEQRALDRRAAAV
jgi:hypothetical protein